MKHADHQLRLFLEICRCPTLSEAANLLGMSQSSLSRTLAGLEVEVGNQLFDRNGRGIKLTEAGVRLRDAARPAYDAIDDVVKQLRNEQGRTTGSIKVATIHTLSYYFMGHVVASFMSQRPAVNISVVGRSSPEVVDLVEAGKAEIGFVYDTAVATDAVEITPLFEETMVLVVQASSPLAKKPSVDLAAQEIPLVAFPPHYALRRMLDRHGFTPKISAEVETVDAMLKLVSLTSACCVLPDRISAELLHDYGLVRVPLSGPALTRRIVAITKKGRAKTALVDFILEIALQNSR
jgi:LysR family cyn operon transcriptional activator